MGNKNLIFILVGLIVILGVGFYVKKQPEKIACTAGVKLCSDGSYVSRTGPKCEFSPCPTIPTHTGWKTYDKDGITFQYPEAFPTTYIRAFDWPPTVNLSSEPNTCSNTGSEIDRTGKSETKIINGHSYCITTVVQGAAGSTYSQYAFARNFGEKTAIFTFTTQEPQCMNYDNPKQTECLDERKNFNLDSLIDEVISTLQIKNE